MVDEVVRVEVGNRVVRSLRTENLFDAQNRSEALAARFRDARLAGCRLRLVPHRG